MTSSIGGVPGLSFFLLFSLSFFLSRGEKESEGTQKMLMSFSSVSLSEGTQEAKNIALQTILPASLLPPPSILSAWSMCFVLIYPMHNLFTCVLFPDQQLLKTNEKIQMFY